MKKKILIGIIIYSSGFALFFIFRLIYGILTPETTDVYRNYQYQQTLTTGGLNDKNDSFQTYSKNNYASMKRQVYKEGVKEAPVTINVEQKYEKVASLISESREFEKSEKETREIVKKHEALIQYEQNSGLKGNRYLNLTIGVFPDKFDFMIEEIRKIGNLKSVEINKFDKTSEYKDLNAKRKTLEESRQSLISLKSRAGKIDEFINLENKIMEVEKQIQEFGIKLGDYDAENEFCTVKLTLIENMKAVKTSPIRHIKTALEWTIEYYGILTVILFIGFLTILIIISILEKTKWLGNFIKKYDQNQAL